MYFFILIVSMKDSKVVTYLSWFMWRCLSHNQENRTSINFGKENIAKWDDFQVKVEFALWLLTGEFIFYSYDCVLGKKIYVKL